MLITKDTPQLPKKLPPPELEWQTGDYAKLQEFRFHIPYGFLLCCKLWNTTPNEVISDFMDNLSCGSWKREGRAKAKADVLSYIIEMGYGKAYFTDAERLQQFTELDAIGMLWPENAGEKIMKLHVKWRKKYYNWWFKKWFQKNNRKTR
jgi:hypothetical protein